MASTDGDSDFSLIDELDDACSDLECPGICTHHLPRHSEVWYDRTETIASYEIVVAAASQGCRHCQFLEAAGRALLLSRPKRSHSVLTQAFNKLGIPPDRDLHSVPGLSIGSFRTVTSNRGYEQYDLGVMLALDGEDVIRLDYTAGIVEDQHSVTALRMPLILRASREALSNALSPSNLEFMLGCVDSCRLNHTDCCDTAPSSYPRRLLDVSDQTVQLVQDGPFNGHYLALSYTWGTIHNPGVLTTDNLVTRLTGPLDVRVMPTLEDAVTVTRRLGFTYLWIDSMCIVQDDEADKGREISKMHDIYNKAFLVISADSAKDPTTGLFDRSDAFEPVQVGLLDGTEVHLIDASDHDEQSYTAMRAWCFQERVVAQRTLIFSTRETIWECKQGTTCACGQDQDRQNNFWNFANTALIFDKKYLVFDIEDDGHYVKVLNGIVRLTPLEFWRKTVERFTRRHITKLDDRMPAISALARALAPSVDSSYIAGLWVADIAYGLSWAGQPDRECSLPARPTWSWLTCPGPVNWRSREQPLTRLVDWSIEVSMHHDAFSKVNAGVLQLAGPITVAAAAYDDARQSFNINRYMQTGAETVLQELPPPKSIRYGTHDSSIPDDLPADLDRWKGPSPSNGSEFHPLIPQMVLDLAARSRTSLCILLWLSKTRALVLSAIVADVQSPQVERLGIITRAIPADIAEGTLYVV